MPDELLAVLANFYLVEVLNEQAISRKDSREFLRFFEFVPYEHWNDPDTGIVQVLYGTVGGLTATGDQLWRQDVAGVQGGEEPDDRFGYALAAGDFDGDKYVDLAIGVPYEAIGTEDQAGAVNVLYGSSFGLSAAGDQLWYQGSGGLQGTAETGDRFGYALAAIPEVVYEVHLPLVLRD